MPYRITKRAVDQLSPANHDVLVWDSEVRGFGVRCRPSGAKHYVLKMRVGGRQRWLTIGRHGSPWTPEMARREALRLLGERAAGNDPATERDHQKGVITVQQLGARFLRDYVPHHCKPRTSYEYRRAVELFINPAIGLHRISDLGRADVAAFHYDMHHHPYNANRVLGVLSKMMNLAEEWGLRPDGSNPCRHVKKYPEIKRERYLSEDELRRLGEVMANRESEGTENPFVIAAVRLLILTGARLNEILTLKWEHVDLHHGVLRLPESKTGAKLIYLNAAAVDLLQSLPRMNDNPYVIPGHKAGAHLVELQKPWRRIRNEAGLDNLRIHDLRHSFASVAVGAGLSLPVIGTLLGHTQPVTTARYAHLSADPLRSASELVGSAISKVMGGSGVARKPSSKPDEPR